MNAPPSETLAPLPDDWDRALAVVAHPDDLEYGATWDHGPLNMADHRVVGWAVMDAARDAANRWVFRDLLDEGLEPWSGTRMVCVNASPHPTHAVDVTGFVDQGVDSLLAHDAYIKGLGGEFDARAFLESHLAAVGLRANCDYAVDLEVIDL